MAPSLAVKGALKPVAGRIGSGGVRGKRALMGPANTNMATNGAGKHRLGGGKHSTGMFAKYAGPGKSKFDGRGQRKFIRNMAAGGAAGAVAGNAAAVGITRGRARFLPLTHAVVGGAAGGAVGVGAVSHHRKVKKNYSVSAFGVAH